MGYISEQFNPNKDISSSVEYLDDSIKTQNVKELIVKNLKRSDSYVDDRIDDLLTRILDDPKLINRGSQTIPLICDTLFRPVHVNEPLPISIFLARKN